MTLRLDSLYDVIVELEEKIEDAKLRRDAIKQQAITLENIYKIMVNNLSKKEDAKVPQCPPEKEAAIMDALKHFQMI